MNPLINQFFWQKAFYRNFWIILRHIDSKTIETIRSICSSLKAKYKELLLIFCNEILDLIDEEYPNKQSQIQLSSESSKEYSNERSEEYSRKASEEYSDESSENKYLNEETEENIAQNSGLSSFKS